MTITLAPLANDVITSDLSVRRRAFHSEPSHRAKSKDGKKRTKETFSPNESVSKVSWEEKEKREARRLICLQGECDLESSGRAALTHI